jgi:putative Holliday junction resolvase
VSRLPRPYSTIHPLSNPLIHPLYNSIPIPRLLAIDYGSKKCGIAASDPLQLIATGVDTVATHALFDWLRKYLQEEEVSDLVVGYSVRADGRENPLQQHILGFERKFEKLYPGIQLHRQDEFYTSKRAKQAMLDMGMRKKQRRDKRAVDKIAACLILQDFMEERR